MLPCSSDPNLWFAEEPADLERAKALCAGCPVRRACLAAALERAEPWGVWGGEILEWVALGVARMLYTFETGDVTSKSGAGRWAVERVPRHEGLFRRAVEVRAERGAVTRDELLECADVAREIVAAVTGR